MHANISEPRPSAPAVDLDLAFKALASPVRREILAMVAAQDGGPDKTCCAVGEVCACKFAEALNLAASTTSHHLNLLVAAGLLTPRKDGVWVYYRLNRPAIAAVSHLLTSL